MAVLAAALATLAPALPQRAADDAPSLAEVRRVVAESVDFLLDAQESYEPDPPVGTLPEDGLEEWQTKERARLDALRGASGAAEWPYEGVYRVRGTIPSGYRVGGTSIVCDTLLRTDADGARRSRVLDAVERSLEFCLTMLEEDETLAAGPKQGYDVRGWGHVYALQFFLTLLEQEVELSDAHLARIEAMIPDLIHRIEVNETAMGGWNYANDRAVSPFMTGATLLTLFEAKTRGYEVPVEVVERALDALEAGRTDGVSYAYSGKVRDDVAMPGSSARSACAELALFKAGRSDVDAMRRAAEGFFEGYEDLLDRKSKQGTHKGPYGIAPYYFFFGHTYAAHAIEELPERERATRRAELARLLWSTRGDDGSWNDRVFPRSAAYSTAMVVLALEASGRKRFARWEAAPAKAGK